ncbi:MAG: hypothetical protein WA030_00160 [Candidatus Microsaccharimonas sp.]
MNPDQNVPADPTPPTPEPTPTPVAPSPLSDPTQPVAPINPLTPDPATPASTDAPSPFGAVPSPVATPVAPPVPVQPTAVFGSSPNNDPIPTPGGNSKKKLIILLSAIVGGLIVLGGIAIAVYVIFFMVTKEDYKKAYDQMSIVQQKTDDGSDISSSSSESTFETVKTAYEEYKVENAKLANLKAIRADADIHQKYVAYEVKSKEFVAFMDAFLPSYGALLTATDSLSALSSDFSSASVQTALSAFETASGDITDPTLKTYVDSVIVSYKELLVQIKVYESASSNSEKLAALNKISPLTSDLGDAATTMSKDLKERSDAVSPKDTFNALSKIITQKYNASK